MITETELDAIEARANAATPGPWEIFNDDLDGHIIAGRYSICGGERHEGYVHADDLNIIFIAHARTDVPRLIAEVRQLIAEKETLRRLICGNICRGYNDACFFQGSDEFNPCPLATEEDIADFKYTYSDAMEDEE